MITSRSTIVKFQNNTYLATSQLVRLSLGAGACTGDGLQGTATQFHKYTQMNAKRCARGQADLIAWMYVEPLPCAYMGYQLTLPPWARAIAQYI